MRHSVEAGILGIMKIAKASFLILVGIAAADCAHAEVLDLTHPNAYSEQLVPDYVLKDNTQANNPITDLGATLGRVLFYDKRLSTTRTISCSSCHQQENAFSDMNVASLGVAGTTGRHSMRLVNSRFAREDRFFWDERAATLEAQTTQPIQDHIEMGFSGADGDPDFSDLVERLEQIEAYRVLFTGVFGDGEITEERVQDSLAQFIRSIQSFDSRFDEGLADAPGVNAAFANYTATENRGKTLFLTPPPQGGAGCAGCHQPPEFDIDPNSGHNGVITAIGGGQDLTNTRSPSLRDVVDSEGNSNGPFMHDGSKASLLDVINHYNRIPAITPGLDRRLSAGNRPQRLNLTEQEKADLVAFLHTLSGTDIYANPRWSDPFDENGDLDVVILPQSAQQISLVREGEGEVTRVQFESPAVANVKYILRTSENLVDWSDGVTVTAESDGVLRYEQVYDSESGKLFFQASYIPELIGE